MVGPDRPAGPSRRADRSRDCQGGAGSESRGAETGPDRGGTGAGRRDDSGSADADARSSDVGLRLARALDAIAPQLERITGSVGAQAIAEFGIDVSQIHWDMVNIQREDYGGGTIYFDGKLIRENGRFVPKQLQALNPERLVG